MESASIYGVEMYIASVIAQELTVFILSGAYGCMASSWYREYCDTVSRVIFGNELLLCLDPAAKQDAELLLCYFPPVPSG